jgi:hypothetical protein
LVLMSVARAIFESWCVGMRNIGIRNRGCSFCGCLVLLACEPWRMVGMLGVIDVGGLLD